MFFLFLAIQARSIIQNDSHENTQPAQPISYQRFVNKKPEPINIEIPEKIQQFSPNDTDDKQAIANQSNTSEIAFSSESTTTDKPPQTEKISKKTIFIIVGAVVAVVVAIVLALVIYLLISKRKNKTASASADSAPSASHSSIPDEMEMVEYTKEFDSEDTLHFTMSAPKMKSIADNTYQDGSDVSDVYMENSDA